MSDKYDIVDEALQAFNEMRSRVEEAEHNLSKAVIELELAKKEISEEKKNVAG